MTKKTCQAGKDVCKQQRKYDLSMTNGWCPSHPQLGTAGVTDHHTDATPCGEGCKARGILDDAVICGSCPEWVVHRYTGTGIITTGGTTKTSGIVHLCEPQEKPEELGEEKGWWMDKSIPFGELLRKPFTEKEIEKFKGWAVSGTSVLEHRTSATIRSLQEEKDKYKESVEVWRKCYWEIWEIVPRNYYEEAKEVLGAMRLLVEIASRAEKAEAERDELQEHMGVLVEAAVVEQRNLEDADVICLLCGTSGHEDGDPKAHKETCPIPNLPEAARKRAAQIEEWKAKAEALEKVFPFLCAPDPSNGFGRACINEAIKIIQAVLNPKEETQ